MTRKKWMEEHYPNEIGSEFGGGVYGCPHDYEDLPDNDTTNDCRWDSYCTGCWNKEMKKMNKFLKFFRF